MSTLDSSCIAPHVESLACASFRSVLAFSFVLIRARGGTAFEDVAPESVQNNNNNNHFRTERTDINRYETYPTTGFVLLTLDHTHSQVPRPTPSKLYIFMESPPREETKYE